MAFTGDCRGRVRIAGVSLEGESIPMWRCSPLRGAAVLVATMLAALAPTAAARDAALPGQVRCESQDTRRVRCPLDTSRGVVLVRQLSENACIRESDWGVDAGGVWVARGCRAEFRARPSETTTTRRVVRCESRGARVEGCAVALRGAPVRLLRELSRAPCRRGESWDVGRNQILVSRGCKGEFEVGDAAGGFPPGPRLLVCESRDRQRRSCGTTVERSVELVEQLSGAPCGYGSSWGWDAGGIWVSDGCRAKFAVD